MFGWIVCAAVAAGTEPQDRGLSPQCGGPGRNKGQRPGRAGEGRTMAGLVLFHCVAKSF